MKIYIIDLLGEKYHSNFDLSISKCIKRENKTFIGSKDQLKYFINSGIDSTYIIEPLKKGIFNKKISGLINIYKVNKKVGRDSIKVITGFENVSLALYSFIDRAFLKQSYLFIHNNLSGLNKKWKINLLKSVFKKSLGVFFLDKSILEKFLYDYPEFNNYRRKCFYIPHPIENNDNISSKKTNQNKLSFIGRFADDKGAHLFLNVLSKLPQNIKKNIKIIGQVDGHIKERFFSLFENIEVIDNFISPDQYEEAFRNSKFTFLLHNPSKFHYRTSGILYDSIRLGTPVICSNYYVYTTLFNEFKPIGLLLNEYCESELENLIKKAYNIAVDDKEYQAFLANIDKLKKYHSIENVSKILNSIVGD